MKFGRSRTTFCLIALMAIVAVAGLAWRPHTVSAHPLGNFTVNQYTRIELTEDGMRLIYVLDMAEIPAFQERQAIDSNQDGTIDDAESSVLTDKTVSNVLQDLRLSADKEQVGLRVSERRLSFPEGQGGLSLLRLRLILEPDSGVLLTSTATSIDLSNSYDTDRLGWREIVVTHGSGVKVEGVEIPATDASNELLQYPEELLESPLDQREVHFTAALAPGPAAVGYTDFVARGFKDEMIGARPDGGSSGSRFAALLDRSESSTAGLLLTFLAAALWGAAHALSPGHGKTVVGAYLVGSRGTLRHAALLGLTVTVTHTAGVVALGLVTLFASSFILPEQLFPWISAISGLTIVGLGLWTLKLRLRGERGLGHHHHGHDHAHGHSHDHHHAHDHDRPHDHDHDHGHDGAFVHTHGGRTHSHALPEGERITVRSLIALGISGGLLPCPSALVVLLGSIALGRVGYGLALVVAFSLGLAATLTAVGLAFLYASRLLDSRLSGNGRLRLIFRYGPAVGSLALVIAGAAIIFRALGQTGLG